MGEIKAGGIIRRVNPGKKENRNKTELLRCLLILITHIFNIINSRK
jgi:hypothetical protein